MEGGETARKYSRALIGIYVKCCSYDFLEIIELGAENISEHAHDWIDHHDTFSSENEVWEDTESLLPESDAISAGWSRETPASHARRLCGDWSGKLKLLRYQSRGNAIRLRFRADHSRHFAGYRAKVTVADAQSCMDVKQVLFNGHCYLFSGYPKASWATAKQVCEGLNMQLSSVHSADEERFIVTGIRESSDYSARAVYWLGARLISGEFSWSDGSAVLYQGWPPYNETEDLDDACLGFQWKSSPLASQPSGLYWTLHKCAVTGGYVCKRKLTPDHIVKNRTIEGTSGVLSSPNYPSVYDPDLDYWVHVVGPSETRLVFVFHAVDLEYQKDCLYDFVELRDLHTAKSSRYCGSVGETRWVAASNAAVLHFHSDYNTQGSGYSLSWKAVELVGCPSQTFTSKEGVLRSPNYPQFLLPNLDCTIDIIAPAGKRVFLNISHFDFGYGTFDKGVPINITDNIPEDAFLEVQVDLENSPIRPFLSPEILPGGLFVSQSEILRLRLRTGENITGQGYLAHFKTVSFLNVSHVLELGGVRSGRIAAPNWPQRAPARSTLRTRILAPHHNTLTLTFASTVLVTSGESWPCGDGNGWIEVKDSYTDYNGTEWTLCEVDRRKRKLEPMAPLIINSYLHSLVVTQHSGERGMNMDVALVVNQDPEYHSKVLLLSDETSIESCYPNPCLHDGRCASDDIKNFCQCTGYYTGIFCLVTACERSPCLFGNCSLSVEGADGGGGEGGAGGAGGAWRCTCARGWRGRRCAERVRPCAARPCNARGACTERDGSFLCQCNPSWKGKRWVKRLVVS
ncbi:uncharacterized protein LOC115449546 [Manduca sexta]|uniref:uncharacterized protein LOC115449546 n=1 Tax=Manduca sexta TaxID=7130 RepID=UPI0018907269|nr:uncharacterized protein LOC115449546 [Manduca sexta]